MENMICEIRECPRCGKRYAGHSALSRADGRTLICPDCGSREAMSSIGIPEAEQGEILAAMHRAVDNLKEG